MNDRCKAREREVEELKQTLAQREDDLRIARETCELYLADFQRCDRERLLAEAKADKAEENANTLRATRAREVDAAKNKGYDEGWDAAGVEYKKQVREIEAELYRDRFLDGLRFGHEALLKKFDLPADSELRVLPAAPPEELVMPEEGDEQVFDLDAEVPPEVEATPAVVASTGDATQTPQPSNT